MSYKMYDCFFKLKCKINGASDSLTVTYLALQLSRLKRHINDTINKLLNNVKLDIH